ncbi:beta-carboxysome assembly chaperone CcmS [Myxosarcina sp. GI1(2024)]
MIGFGKNRPEVAQQKWRSQLDRFVKENENYLTALVWGLQQEWQNSNHILGIDLKPQPHFVTCTKEDIERLNHDTNGQIQEILGIIDGYQPETEVLIIAIGEGQIKLIHYQPAIEPPARSTEVAEDLDFLIEKLEAILAEMIN